jgi:phytanoyl-CoA hydroxylase
VRAVGTLNYAVDTSRALNNGPLYVVPGSHREGYVAHIDTESHLGLDEKLYSFDEAVCVDGKAGDTLFFHVHTVHGSTPNFSNKPRPTFINRYIHPDDVQTIHATSAAMREEGERGEAEMPVKERNYLVRGRRKWSGLKWDLPVQHH